MTKLVAVFALAACSSEPTSRDDLAGTWHAGSQEFHLRADGSYEGRVRVEDRCRDDTAAIAACMAKQHWDRRGDKVRVWTAFLMFHYPNPAYMGMFKEPGREGAPPCDCYVREEPRVFELRDQNTLTRSDEDMVRVP